MSTLDHIAYFAETDFRNRKIKFGIKEADRARHMYVIGKTGMGKSTLLENLAVQDIMNGNGIGFIDPHGSSAEELLNYIPEHRIKDVVYFAPFDQDHPIAFNVMEDIGKDQRPLVASGLLGAFKKVWVDAWSPRMEYLLNNAILALLEYPNSTLLGVNRMFADKNYRDLVVANVQDPSVKSFWTDEFAKYNERYATEAAAAIQNKVGQFASNPLIRNMMGQPKSSINFREIMDGKKIFIANLSKGRIGEGNASLIGGMLITKLYLAAMSRAEMSNDVLHGIPSFFLYVDEFQSFANESFADILSEARKYKLSLTIAHQYIEQMSEEVRAAVFGNVGTTISFRVGALDSELLEKEFAPTFTGEDLVNLGFAQIYLKLMINGIGSAPFSAVTLPRPPRPEKNFRDTVIESSRQQFSKDRSLIEDDIRAWHAPVPSQKRGDGGGEKRQNGGERKTNSSGSENGNRNNTTYTPPREEERRGKNASPLREQSSNPPQDIHKPFRSAFTEPGIPVERKQDKPREDSRLHSAGVVGEQKDSLEVPSYPKKDERASLHHMSGREKGPSVKNMQSLKDALATAMRAHQSESKKVEKKESLPTMEEISTMPKNVIKAEHPSSTSPLKEKNHGSSGAVSKEIPERVLRKVLGE